MERFNSEKSHNYLMTTSNSNCLYASQLFKFLIFVINHIFMNRLPIVLKNDYFK